MFKRLSETLAAYQARDPAARSKLEIFLLYPGVHAILFHRVSHWLYRHRLFFLARLNSQIARHITGIEIHPGARIGRRFVIDQPVVFVVGVFLVTVDSAVGGRLAGLPLNPDGGSLLAAQVPQIPLAHDVDKGSELAGTGIITTAMSSDELRFLQNFFWI